MPVNLIRFLSPPYHSHRPPPSVAAKRSHHHTRTRYTGMANSVASPTRVHSLAPRETETQPNANRSGILLPSSRSKAARLNLQQTDFSQRVDAVGRIILPASCSLYSVKSSASVALVLGPRAQPKSPERRGRRRPAECLPVGCHSEDARVYNSAGGGNAVLCVLFAPAGIDCSN